MAAQWMTVDNTSARWPSNGTGGNTATAASSITKNNTGTVVYGLLVLTASGAADTAITIYAHNGTSVMHTIPISDDDLVVSPQIIPIGGPNGLQIPSGISAKTSDALTTVELYFNTLTLPIGI